MFLNYERNHANIMSQGKKQKIKINLPLEIRT